MATTCKPQYTCSHSEIPPWRPQLDQVQTPTDLEHLIGLERYTVKRLLKSMEYELELYNHWKTNPNVTESERPGHLNAVTSRHHHFKNMYERKLDYINELYEILANW